MRFGGYDMEDNIKELNDKSFDETLKGSDKLVIVEVYNNTCPNCRAIAMRFGLPSRSTTGPRAFGPQAFRCDCLLYRELRRRCD